MESIIVLIVLAVISNLISKGNKKKEQAAGGQEQPQSSQALDESWAGSITVPRRGAAAPAGSANEPNQQNGSQTLTETLWTAPGESGQDFHLAIPDLCEANPMVTPSANMRGATMIEAFDQKEKEQQLAEQNPLKNEIGNSNAHKQNPISTMSKTLTSIKLMDLDGGPGVDLMDFGKNQGFTTLQQGVVFAEILGKPVARRFGA